jgi:hypothetical protein
MAFAWCHAYEQPFPRRMNGNSSCATIGIGDPGEIRTPDHCVRSAVLYPLSYGAMTQSGAGTLRMQITSALRRVKVRRPKTAPAYGDKPKRP